MKKIKWMYVLLATFLLTSCGTLMQPYQMDSKMKDKNVDDFHVGGTDFQ